jgi:hypothetical protein
MTSASSSSSSADAFRPFARPAVAFPRPRVAAGFGADLGALAVEAAGTLDFAEVAFRLAPLEAAVDFLTARTLSSSEPYPADVWD